LWDAKTGREIRRMSARALGFAPGLRLVLTDARSWSLSRIEHGDHLRVLRVHTGKAPRDLAFAPGGRAVASTGPDGVYLWDGRADSRPELVFDQEARVVDFVDGGRALVASGPSGLWRIPLEPRGEAQQILSEPLKSMSLSADGRVLAVQGESSIHLLDPAGMRALGSLRGPGNMEYLATSADGSRVAAGNWKGRGVRVWTPRESDVPRLFLPEQDSVATALSPDGELLATVSSERLELWHTKSGERLHAVERRRAFSSSPAPAAFSPDGTLLAFGLSNEIVGLIDVRTLESRGTLEPPEPSPPYDLCFSPDGSVLGAACTTNRVQLWDLAQLWRELGVLGLSTER
jgi:WD40 repeat protein